VKEAQGTLVIIGGHEGKDGDCAILREVAKCVGSRKLVVTTVASHEPEGYFGAYQRAFGKLGLNDLDELYVDNRAESLNPEKLTLLDGVGGVFFSGGDQLRISSQIGGTPFERKIQDLFLAGGVVAGTSAGASALGETMLIRGPGAESHRIGDIHLAPGLGLLRGVIIDQHFAERGRIGRLLGSVALDPRILGIGIDEDTAIVVHSRRFRVIGSGAVYVIDGTGGTRSNIAEAEGGRPLSMFDVRLHVLSDGDGYDLDKRHAIPAGTQ